MEANNQAADSKYVIGDRATYISAIFDMFSIDDQSELIKGRLNGHEDSLSNIGWIHNMLAKAERDFYKSADRERGMNQAYAKLRQLKPSISRINDEENETSSVISSLPDINIESMVKDTYLPLKTLAEKAVKNLIYRADDLQHKINEYMEEHKTPLEESNGLVGSDNPNFYKPNGNPEDKKSRVSYI